MAPPVARNLTRHMVFRFGSPRVRAYRLKQLVRIDRGVYLKWEDLLGHHLDGLADWQTQEIVDLARLYAAAYRYRETLPILTGVSALVAHDVPHWRRNVPVMVRRMQATDTLKSKLPRVLTPNLEIPSVEVMCRAGSAFPDSPRSVQAEGSPFLGLKVADPSTVAIDLVRTQNLFEAFVNVGLLLTHRNPFNKFQPGEQATEHRQLVDAILRDIEGIRGNHGTKRLTDILRLSKAGLDSPGEAALLWMVIAWWGNPGEVVTQHYVKASGKNYFIDVAIPHLGIAFEFDGASKMGNTETDWQSRSTAFLDRQRNLLQEGWKVTRVTFSDLTVPGKALALVGEALRGMPGAQQTPGGPLWTPENLSL